MNEALQAVIDYTQTPRTDCALLINGPWGCGKTYFWKNVIEPRLRQMRIGDAKCQPLYASLYGCQSARDVDTQLLLASYPLLKQQWTKRLASAGGGVVRQVFRAFTHIDLPAIDLRWLVCTKNAVLCFDDLERTRLPMKEALGYINTFVEHEGVKVIILCNEDAISAGGDDKKTYYAMKEKVVGASLEFRAELDAVFDALVREHHTYSDFHKFLATNMELLRRLFDQSETHNIRSLRRALSALAVIFEALQSHNIDPNKLGEQLIFVVAPGAFELHGRGVEPDKLRDILGADNMAIAGLVAKSRMEHEESDASEHAFKAGFAERYFEGLGLAKWRTPVGCPPICEYLLTGFLDRRAVVDWASQLIKPLDEREERIKRLTWGPRDMPDDEFVAAVERTIAEVEGGDVATIGSYFGLYRSLEWFADAGLTAYSRQELLEKFTNGLTKARDRGLLKAEPHLSSQLDHCSFEAATPEQRMIKQLVLKGNETLLAAELRERARSLMSIFADDCEQFITALSDDSEDGWGHSPVFHELQVGEVANGLLRISNPLKVQFLHALHARYERRPVACGFSVELPALEQLKESLNSRVTTVAERPIEMSVHLVGEIVKTLEQVISQLRKASPEGAEPATSVAATVSKENGDDETK